ncbi:MAG: leucine-rich repeat domain-containing protein, partial [Cyanobacteria bacterium J06639_16]
SHNRILNVGSLANLTSLNTLNLSNNLISELTPLANLERLSSLKVGDNPLEDISCPVQPDSTCEFY